MTAAAAFADALGEAFATGAFDALSGVLLHRVRQEDGLAETIGRDAVLAGLVAMAADGAAGQRPGGDPRAAAPGPLTGWVVQRAGDAVLARGGDRLCAWWVEGEGGRVAALVRVDARPADAAAAAALGAAHPAHRPVGELRSGRAQYAPDVGGRTPGERYTAAIDARALSGLPQRAWWLRLLARLPDAAVALDRESAGGAAVLWRVQGHRDSRRVSLPGISLLTPDGDGFAAEQPLLDLLALEASAHRPLL